MLRILFAIILMLSCGYVFAQPSRSDLEKQRQSLLESIQQTKEQLAATTNNKQATLSQLRALQAQLSVRQKLINNINQDINGIDNNIHSSASEINHLQTNLEKQQIRYAQSVRYSYKYRNSYDMLAFLFSATDFNEAVRRMKYLKRYRDYRSEQLEQIKNTQYKIHNTINTLNTQKTEKSELLNNQQSQTQELKKATTETDAVVKELKGREKELNAQIDKGQKAARNINQQINRVIQHEMEVARKRLEEEERKKREQEEERKRLAAQQQAAQQQQAANGGYGNVKVNTGSGKSINPPVATASKPEANNPAETRNEPRNTAANNEAPSSPRPVNTGVLQTNAYRMSLTPEVAALSDNFEANRGKLPWPVEKGYISLGFGKYRHPTQGQIELDNYGIYIDTSPGAGIRSVFDGKVTSVLYISGSGWMVIVNHGIYFTVYNGLSNVSVKKDQQVHVKQNIGVVGLNEEGIPQLGFQIWKAAMKVDPAQWIAR